LLTSIRLGWQRLANDKHSSLLGTFLNYGHKLLMWELLSSALPLYSQSLD
jgi:hypothetical protein